MIAGKDTPFGGLHKLDELFDLGEMREFCFRAGDGIGHAQSLTEEDVVRFSGGLDLGDVVTEKAELILEGPRTGLVTIHEGKFHQVKRMFEAVGKQVLELDRLSFGPLTLPVDLPRGAWRELTQEESKSLYRQVGMEEPV